MRVSVIIPCFDAESTVGEAVRSAFQQTLSPLEVLVVDDCSADRSGEVAQAAGATVLRSGTRRNAGGARNLGLERAEGELIAFLDADAVVPHDWLERVSERFRDHPEVVAVGGRIVNGRPSLWGKLDYYLNHSEWMGIRPSGPRSNLPTMAAVYRRTHIGDLRFIESNSGEDTAFNLQIVARGGVIWYDRDIAIVHNHERLDRRRFWDKQVLVGRTIYWTRAELDRPGKVLVRYPVLLLLFPHLWMVLARMLRAGQLLDAVTLLPWMVLGEAARIRGFHLERRDRQGPGARPRS